MSVQPIEFPQGVGWIVTRQEPDQVSFSTPGDPVYGVNVYFATASGHNGVVFVPYTRYHDVRFIHSELQRAARLADEVGQLTSASFQ